tara:strand:- start:70 stop:516 length:447 start_codon:yes stop_codon:yes gene_type:complete
MKTLSVSLIISVLTIVFVLSCSSIEIDDDFFECTVDYVEFIDESNAIVRFETTLGKETNYYYGRYTYTKNGSEYLIGDNMVNIRGFESKNNTASFTFEYGENLGFFCATLFAVLPVHIHYTFDAEAELSTSSKGVGKWKIKRKSNFRE